MRWSIDEALARGVITAEDAAELRKGGGRRAPKVTGRERGAPEEILWGHLQLAFPGVFARQVGGLVPGRRYRVDFYAADADLVVEVVGWQFHGGGGHGLKSFQRDLERMNLLVEHGHKLLLYGHADVTTRPGEVLAQIERVLGGLDAEDG